MTTETETPTYPMVIAQLEANREAYSDAKNKAIRARTQAQQSADKYDADARNYAAKEWEITQALFRLKNPGPVIISKPAETTDPRGALKHKRMKHRRVPGADKAE